MTSAEGRFDVCRANDGCIGIVDYAHTPDALLNVINTINEIKNNQQLITVFGCGGDRDKSKRSKMGQIASELSNRVIITSDNPRTENPDDILNEIVQGVKPKHLKKVVIGDFLFLSIFTVIKFLFDVSISIQAPL